MLRLIPAPRSFSSHLGHLLSLKSPSVAGRSETTCAYLIKYAQAEKTP